MIKVNLLPQADSSGGKPIRGAESAASAGGVVVALLLVLAYMGVIAAGYLVFNAKYQSIKMLEKAKKEQQVVKAEIERLEKEYKDLKTIKALYENQLEVLNALDPPERLLWAEKMNLLPQLVPEGIFLTRILVTEEVKEVETKESIRRRQEWEKSKARKGARPVPVKRPVIKQTLTLSGIAYVEGAQSDKKRLQVFIDFVNNLKYKEAVVPYTQKKKTFMEFFDDVVYEPFASETVAGREVSVFVLKLRTQEL